MTESPSSTNSSLNRINAIIARYEKGKSPMAMPNVPESSFGKATTFDRTKFYNKGMDSYDGTGAMPYIDRNDPGTEGMIAELKRKKSAAKKKK